MRNEIRGKIKNHPYQILGESPWPIMMSINIMNMMILIGLRWNNYVTDIRYIKWNVIMTMIINIGLWMRDIYVESKLLGEHTKRVKRILKEGFIMFQISEIIIFITLIGIYMSVSMNTPIELGMGWPPKGIKRISGIEWSLINTIILIISGISITYAERVIKLGRRKEGMWGIGITIILIGIFVYIQREEYKMSSVTILSGIYGSIFYILTGLHGIHMILLIIMLINSEINIYKNIYTRDSHMSLELTVMYLHILDIIWLWIYYILYIGDYIIKRRYYYFKIKVWVKISV